VANSFSKKVNVIMVGLLSGVCLVAGGLTGTAATKKLHIGHGFAMHGTPKYGPDFSHFEYVNPKAPKGGTITFSAIGTFDNLNAYILKGLAPAGASLLYEKLAIGSYDEAFSMYGSVASVIEFPEDRSWVAFTIRPEARFHDGTPITAEDVAYTFQLLTTLSIS